VEEEEMSLGQKNEHIPMRLQQIMEEYGAQSTCNKSEGSSRSAEAEVEEIEEMSRSFDDVITLESSSIVES
jgi:hypothetical protein